jgi:cobalt/nickel transport system permease protein
MHIPDGYLSPQTYLPAFGVMAPLWALASHRLQRTLRLRQVPLLALGAAFTFVIMMFNVPIPGGTTGHAVGAVLVAILLGPWAAVIAVSLALVVQALLFGDGGITAIGANCFTMAVVMPFVGWGVYRLLGGDTATDLRRRLLAGAVASYVGLNASALATAVLFGIQPLIARDAAGRALYCPFDLSVAVPVMATEHLLVFGIVEAVATGLALAYLHRAAPEILPVAAPARRPWLRPAVALLVLALLAPVGMLLPQWLKAGDAWGEWVPEDLPAQMQAHGHGAGYVPTQLERLSALWKAPIADYAPPGEASLPWQSVVYIGSGLLGMGVIVLLVLLGRRWLAGKDPDGLAARVDASPGG